jgi:hypothetical protein
MEAANDNKMDAPDRLEAHATETEEQAQVLLLLLTHAVDIGLAAQLLYKLVDRLIAGPEAPAKFAEVCAAKLTLPELIARVKAKTGRIDLLDPALPSRMSHILQAPELIEVNLLRGASFLHDALHRIVTEKPVRDTKTVADSACAAHVLDDDYASAGLIPVVVRSSSILRAESTRGVPVLLGQSLPSGPLDPKDALNALSALASPTSPFAREALEALGMRGDAFLAMLAGIPKRTFFRFKVLNQTQVLYDEATDRWLLQISINYDAAVAALRDANRSGGKSAAVVYPALKDHLERKLAAGVALARMALGADGPGPGLSLVQYHIPVQQDHSSTTEPAKVARTGLGPIGTTRF